ncbi:MAG TPA: hypothetical protein VNZ52_01250 [Candidatus Thermoplasmatota archaeon]|nr:hypothetical protein [Candidatus Thermoplasmatota archaeon]
MTTLDDPRVKQYIRETVGDEGMRLAELLTEKQEATDSELAEEMGEKPSHIRKILYDLYEARIAEYHKEKDKDTGWLTFYWSLNPTAAAHAVELKRKREIGALTEKLRFEQEHEWYICPRDQNRLEFTEAAEHNFHCGDCGTLLEAHDNREEVKMLQMRIAELMEEAKEISTGS